MPTPKLGYIRDGRKLPGVTTILKQKDSSGLIAGANSMGRKGLIIQNTGTTIIRLVLGTGTPSQTVYHVALKACSAADDGSGGVYVDDSWIGAIQAISSAASGTMVICETSVGSPTLSDMVKACDNGVR
jgi:hypothetical protein